MHGGAAARGFDATWETVRCWANQFGPALPQRPPLAGRSGLRLAPRWDGRPHRGPISLRAHGSMTKRTAPVKMTI